MHTNLHDRNRTKTDRTLSRMSRQPGLLVVDELALNLVLLKLELQQLGCVVWLAGNGLEAMQLYERHHEIIDLVMLEVEMVGLDGPQTLAGLREIDPDVRCCFVTDDRVAFTKKELRYFGAELILNKPFNPAVVSRIVWKLSCARMARDDETTEME